MRYMLEPVQITYKLAYLNIYLILLYCKLNVINNFKIYDTEHFEIEYRSLSCIFQVRYHGLF